MDENSQSERSRSSPSRLSCARPDIRQTSPRSLASYAAAAVATSVPLMRLCESLHDRSADLLQVKINRYVIGTRRLKDEIKFTTESTCLRELLTLKANNYMTETNFTQNQLVTLSDKLGGLRIKNLLAVSVLGPNAPERTVIVACAFNKKQHKRFSETDVSVIVECFRYTRSILINTLAFEEERRLKIQCQSLLTVAKNLFRHLDDVTVLLQEIMAEARHLTKAERCSLFLLDEEHHELVAKVFDGQVPEQAQGHENGNGTVEMRMPVGQGIAGHVAMTGELLNIHDAYSHPLFYREMDKTTGFRTRNILCFPIRGENCVIGIAELCNKVNGLSFTTFDEEIAMAFSVYCGISIMHSLMWKKVRDAHNRSKLSNELMMYHMQVSPEEVKSLAKSRIPSPSDFDSELCQFSFFPRKVVDRDTPLVVISMAEELGFLTRWRIRHDTFARFVLMVKKGYRDPPYHNWLHAFSVAHFSYLTIKNFELIQKGHLTSLECLALFIACLCHDLDHRGTTSSFQVESKSVLAALYSSEGSVMERHHFAQAMCILNTEGCNVFENLSRKEYTKILDLIRDLILATDLAHHLRALNELREMADSGFEGENIKHHNLLMCLLVTASDLSDQTKDFRSAKKIAELVYREFFSQGDLEKAMGHKPSQMMDREKASIPELQISFISHIALPVYQILAKVFPAAHVTVDAVQGNLEYWQRLSDLYKRRDRSTIRSSLDIFDDAELEREVFAGSHSEN
uniref:3',5'-cyclic-GMP phosphodiesterase n=1 Tax=Strigamia maritima TaxID=126957 RepID=T1J3H1_STRMM